MKKLLFLGSLVLATAGIKAQTQDSLQYKNQVKGNLLFAPIGMLNVGYEHAFNNHWTGQVDLFVSPWKSFGGKHAQIALVGVDGRYYFRKAFEGFYVGGNITGGVYNVQKWNYWNDSYYTHKNGDATPYIEKNLYQKGYTFVLGAVGGYQFVISDRWTLDLYLGIGTMQSFYKGYDKISGDRYDNLEDSMGRDWNRSGEWMPYRGGLMLSYKF